MRPVAAILRALEAEARDSARLARTVQAALGDAATSSGLDEAAIEGLQGIDALSQRLDGVSAFLRALAPAAPASWTLDAARAAAALPLAGLARRLAGAPEPGPGGPGPGEPEPGEPELFGDG